MKTHFQFEAVCEPKFTSFWHNVGDPCGLQSVKFTVRLRSRPKMVVFGPPIYRRRGYPRYFTCVFKLHLLPTMWPDMVEFRSVSSEIRRRKNKKEIKNPW